MDKVMGVQAGEFKSPTPTQELGVVVYLCNCEAETGGTPELKGKLSLAKKESRGFSEYKLKSKR